MKVLSILSFLFAAVASHAVGIGVIGGGGGGGGDDECAPISATVYANDLVTFTGTAVNGADQVKIEITTPGDDDVATLTVSPDVNGNFSAAWFPPVDATYTVHASTYLNGLELSCQTVAFVSAVRPDAFGKITGGGWYELNGGKDTMGFVAQVLGNGSVRGNWEFQDHSGSKNFKSSSVDWVYAPSCSEGFFSGYCKLNGVGNLRFFVHVFDNGEPGSSDFAEFNVYDPNSGALVYSYSKTFSKGNVQVHCK
ncbi:MAG: hypothetical protein JST30_12525 [Armatimonadetes bacterium]|nr:hypothetical protein [Armatimonadota bacterium]